MISQIIEDHAEISWNDMTSNKDGTYGKCVLQYITDLKMQAEFTEGTYEYTIIQANKLLDEEKELKKALKEVTKKIHVKTKECIETLSGKDALSLLEMKWIKSLMANLNKLPDTIIDSLISRIQNIARKYETTYNELEMQIIETERQLSSMIDDLEGDEFDMKGLGALKALLQGE